MVKHHRQTKGSSEAKGNMASIRSKKGKGKRKAASSQNEAKEK